MASPVLREALLHGHASGAGVTLTTAAGTTQAGDWLWAVHGSDFYAASGMGAPGGGAGTWSQTGATADLATNNSHMKGWITKLGTGGAKTVSFSPITDEECFGLVAVVGGADGTNAVDDVQSAATDPGASTAHNAPAVTPATATALAVSVILTQVFSLTNYTLAGGWTKVYEDDDSSTSAAATKTLSASGSTGVVPWVADIINCKFVAITIAFKEPASGGGPVPQIIVPPTAVSRAGSW